MVSRVRLPAQPLSNEKKCTAKLADRREALPSAAGTLGTSKAQVTVPGEVEPPRAGLLLPVSAGPQGRSEKGPGGWRSPEVINSQNR